MALKNGFCVHCKGEERLRIFGVNKDAKICYCPHCTTAMQPKEAIANYAGLISAHLKKASKYLFESTEYLSAYQEFAYILDLDDTIKVAYFGRILALVYLSTLRTSKIYFAHLMHKQQAPRLFHYQETAHEYFNFLWLLLDALDTYENNMKTRLTSRGIYYDVDCIVLYIQRLDEIRKYKNFIATEASYFVEFKKEHFANIIERVKKDNERYDVAYNDAYTTADGHNYCYVGLGSNGIPLLAHKLDAPKIKIHHIKPAFLNAKDNKKSTIKDEIFLNNLPLSRLVNMSVPLAIAFLSSAVIAMVISFFVPNPLAKIIIYISSIALSSVSLMLIILHFSWKNRLKKKYYNGTNPFIFK